MSRITILVSMLLFALNAFETKAQKTAPTLTKDLYEDVIDHRRFDSLWRASKRFGKLHTNAVWSEAYATYRQLLADADPGPFYVDSRLAFWINAYLAVLMKVMQLRVGYRSTVWDSLLSIRDTFIIAHERHTLRSLSDTIIATAQTVRVRAFLCSGSSNAPPFPTGACFAKTMKESLREQLRRVCRSERYVLYDPAANVLQLSVMFKEWFDEMIVESGSVVDFLLPWITEAAAAQLALRKEGMQTVISDRIEKWNRAR
ncbi:MAG: DUF547 domain-containing protein [Ignavibacteria bacterium]|nr:DUF547 domain-containing protein [Ignavibacteria bacterium]